MAPLPLFVFGPKRIVPVRITELSITEEAFDTNLNPIRAKLSLGLRVLTVDDLGFDAKGGGLFMTYLQAKEQLAQQSTRRQLRPRSASTASPEGTRSHGQLQLPADQPLLRNRDRLAHDGRTASRFPTCAAASCPLRSRFALLREHAVSDGERMDLIAARELGDPRPSGASATPNDAMRPEDLTAPIGRRLRITLPEGIPGTPGS